MPSGPSVEVIIPWRGECPHRERALAWLLERLGSVTIAQAPEGVWSKGAALLPAVAASEAEIVVIHDADVYSDGLQAAVDAVEAGEPWAMPHGTVYRLSEASTGRVLDGLEPDLSDLARGSYTGWWGGGIVALPRETYLSVPMDPRFEDWGGEDLSWANALWFLTGHGWRGPADLIHLFHPPHPYSLRGRGSPASRELARRYRHARRDPNDMRRLVDEIGGRDELGRVDEQALHPASAV